jgi:hypothetical protein
MRSEAQGVSNQPTAAARPERFDSRDGQMSPRVAFGDVGYRGAGIAPVAAAFGRNNP